MLSFEEFKQQASRMADSLHTTISRVFNDRGNYTAYLNECEAFDRLKITGRKHARSITVNYGAGHTRVFPVH